MIIPLDKLFSYNQNKYIFTCAAIKAVDKVANIKNLPEDAGSHKVVPHILGLMLDGGLKFESTEDSEKTKS